MRRILIVGVPVVLAIAVALLLLGGMMPGQSEPPAVGLSTPTSATASPTPTATPSPSPTPSPTPEPSETERYRAAIAARDRGEHVEAVSMLRRIAGDEGVLAPFASFRLAQALAAAGRYEEAAGAFARALDDAALPASLRPIGQLEGARALAAAGQTAEAITWLTQTVDDVSASTSEQTSARWERLQLLREAGDPAWAEDAVSIVALSPGHYTASLALDLLEADELDAPALAAAYTRYLARENSLATDRYEAILADELVDDATAAVAWFYLGALAERVPDRERAIAAYNTSLTIDPVGSRADDAAYWRGRVAEEDGDFEAAASYYDTLVAEYPGSGFVADAELRAALALVEVEEEALALDRLGAIAAAGGVESASAARWYDLIAGIDARVEAGIPSAAEIEPRSIGAILERAGPSALERPVSEPLPSLQRDDEAIDLWMAATFGLSTGTSRIDEDEFFETARILVDAGERSLARAIAIERLDAIGSDPQGVIALAARATDEELPDVALIASIRLLAPLPTATRLETPRDLERLAYPAPWSELLIAASEEFDVPPLLLLALIRQESAFEPDVFSPAGAIGLTQVIPPTGVQIAGDLGERWGGPVSLTDPETSLRYGAAYLSTQLETFDGDMFAALAAYNAGPTNAQRWLDSQVRTGADGFIQTIDFEETRRYVSHVVEQYAWYRYVYGVADEPSIR